MFLEKKNEISELICLYLLTLHFSASHVVNVLYQELLVSFKLIELH